MRSKYINFIILLSGFSLPKNFFSLLKLGLFKPNALAFHYLFHLDRAFFNTSNILISISCLQVFPWPQPMLFIHYFLLHFRDMRLHKKYLFYFTLALHYPEWLKKNTAAASWFHCGIWKILERFEKERKIESKPHMH